MFSLKKGGRVGQSVALLSSEELFCRRIRMRPLGAARGNTELSIEVNHQRPSESSWSGGCTG